MIAGQASLHETRDGDSIPWNDEGLAAVVISGAGARGAYEAGVLSTLLPALFPQGLAQVLLLGSSAGAINATLWAQLAVPGRPLAEVGTDVCRFWEDLDVEKVYRPIAWTTIQRALRLDWIGRVDALLDTTPSVAQSRRTFSQRAIESNLAAGGLAGVGVVATTCPLDGSGGRSRLFYQAGNGVPTPEVDTSSALDFVPVAIHNEHVLASAAIPSLFPAVRISTPPTLAGYYCDGGLRLNTPIRPALALGAKRLLVVSSNETRYPAARPLPNEKPDVVDLAAQSMHVALADGMVEDLRNLRRINSLVAQAQKSGVELINYGMEPPAPYVALPLVTVSPAAGQLAQLARQVLTGKPPRSLRRLYRRLEYQLLRRSFAGLGSGPGNDELLSYLFFDPDFARQQILRGREDGRAAFEDLKRRGLYAAPPRLTGKGPVARA